MALAIYSPSLKHTFQLTSASYVASNLVRALKFSLIGPGSRSLDVFTVQNPAEVAAFVYECRKACLAMSPLSDLG